MSFAYITVWWVMKQARLQLLWIYTLLICPNQTRTKAVNTIPAPAPAIPETQNITENHAVESLVGQRTDCAQCCG